MNYPIEGLNHSYLGSGVYALLREALITGRFKPDDRLRIRDLAQQLGTSVTPVRSGRTTLYRARVTGLSRSAAEQACGRLRSRGDCTVIAPGA